MSLKGKKVAVLIENFYEDMEVWVPVYRLKEEGATVTLIGPKMDTYLSKHNYPAKAELGITEARSADFDAVLIPGGYAPDHMRRSPSMVAFVRAMDKEGKIVAAICHAGWMLASANIIKGRRLTGFYSIKDDLVNAGALYEDSEVVQDKNLITSRTPSDLPAFCRTIIAALSK